MPEPASNPRYTGWTVPYISLWGEGHWLDADKSCESNESLTPRIRAGTGKEREIYEAEGALPQAQIRPHEPIYSTIFASQRDVNGRMTPQEGNAPSATYTSFSLPVPARMRSVSEKYTERSTLYPSGYLLVPACMHGVSVPARMSGVSDQVIKAWVMQNMIIALPSAPEYQLVLQCAPENRPALQSTRDWKAGAHLRNGAFGDYLRVSGVSTEFSVFAEYN
ncbi:hypothetical protein BDV93DRAFT_512545 [Ceratobasidium sp. AG-I]|nr:hypothetical protein BDV93DRAFT_512545 [Ceratobasidium sp. AG-I]